MTYILIFCTLAIGHSLFSATALLVLSRKPFNKLLALLLVLLAIRIGKSVVQMFLKPEISYMTSAMGVVAMAAIGPVLWLLMRSLFNTNHRLRTADFLHFIPAVLAAPLIITYTWKFLNPVYLAITLHVLVYIVVTFVFVWMNRETFKADDLKFKWALTLLTSIGLLWCSFMLQITNYHPIVYAVNVITAAITFYGLSMWALKNGRLFLPESSVKPENTVLLDELGQRIQHLLDNEQIYMDSNLTVSKLAMRLKSQPYLVSRAVNQYFKKSFSEVLLIYRIAHAQRSLVSSKSKNLTIEAIAFESGFNTLSIFYAAFKKIHKCTPAQYRQKESN
jgi:AraC-like DNA-binding protein